MLDGRFYDKGNAYQGNGIQHPNLPVGVNSWMVRKEEHEGKQHTCRTLRKQEQHIPQPENALCPDLKQHNKEAEASEREDKSEW